LTVRNSISARQTTSGTQGSEALLQAANKVIEKSLSAVNKASPPKQVLQQQLQQKKADQTKKQQQQEQLQQKKKLATNSEQDRLKNLYKVRIELGYLFKVSNQLPFYQFGRRNKVLIIFP
jgi:hypothetical protein